MATSYKNHNKYIIILMRVNIRLKINLTETEVSYLPEAAGKYPTMSRASVNGIHPETPE